MNLKTTSDKGKSMNIKEAKEFIKDTVSLYLKKDEYGDYRIPVVRQRPVFLLGAPGIGKTAIMEQIASELNIALVSYSMTHHTRQSALGLPFIDKKEYGNKTYSVSEYTMSEIIASVYETIKESGVKEGILFLDEINCVSETLYPSMLQFLQYKTFGRHRVPEGWVIVTAGNPPEFNKAVREFDVVTLDRLKVLEVEADYPAWKEYAQAQSFHGAVVNFIAANREYFYKIENTAEGKNYVTARGWEDLSQILYLYEEEGLPVSAALIGQYIHDEQVIREFAAYYELYNRYRENYMIEGLLKGEFSDALVEKARDAEMDERLALEGLILDYVKADMKDVIRKSDALRALLPALKKAKESDSPAESLKKVSDALKESLRLKELAGSLQVSEKREYRLKESILSGLIEKSCASNDPAGAMSEAYNEEVKALKTGAAEVSERLKNSFLFTDKAFGPESKEMLVAVTELTVDKNASAFLATFGSDEYDKYSSLLMVGNREADLRRDIAELL